MGNQDARLRNITARTKKNTFTKGSSTLELVCDSYAVSSWLTSGAAKELVYARGTAFAGTVMIDDGVKPVIELFEFVRDLSTNLMQEFSSIEHKAGSRHLAMIHRKIGPDAYEYVVQRL
jgi:hypothetical protein